MDALLLPVALDPCGVLAQRLDVGVEVVLAIFPLGEQDVLRVAVERVDQRAREHAAHRGVGHHLVQGLGRQRARHKLIVDALVDDLLVLVGRVAVEHESDRREAVAKDRVDFVEGQPVFDQVAELCKAGLGIANEVVDHRAVVPAAVEVGQRERLLVVVERDQRLDAAGAHGLKKPAVEIDALLQRLGLGPRGVEAGPLDRDAQGLEAHLLD